MSNPKSRENEFSLFSCRIHMTPKRPDHKTVWRNGKRAHSSVGGKRHLSWLWAADIKQGRVPNPPGHTWGIWKRGSNSDRGVHAEWGGGGGGRIKSTWWHSWPTSGHKLQKQGSRPPHCPVPASKASDLKAEAEVPPSGWLLRVNDEVFKWMLHWNTASISTVLAKNHQIKFIFS